jgi:aerobic-type carbon monoxide dehydrogenase small subunit (CoxS/CutS family)
MNAITVSVTLNGRARQLQIVCNEILADVLRERFGLTGCKIGCDQGTCGACTVLVNGQPVAACTTFAFAVDGAEVTTIEGLVQGDALHPVQKAFLNHSAFQCGFCAPGIILSIVALFADAPRPDEQAIRRWLDSNLCRCTGYNAIVDAARELALRQPETA